MAQICGERRFFTGKVGGVARERALTVGHRRIRRPRLGGHHRLEAWRGTVG